MHTWLKRLRPIHQNKYIVVVGGMPKSGTTAIAKLLAEATGKHICSDPFYQLDQKNIIFREDLFNKKISLEYLWNKSPEIFSSGSIIKDPNFPLLMPELKKFLPEAQFVSIIRDPRDNIRSVLNRLDLPGRPNEIDFDAAAISETWRKVLVGRAPNIPGENYIEVLAWRWRLSAEAFLKYRDACIEIRYEDFKSNKAGEITRLANNLGYYQLNNIKHLVDIQYQPRGNSDTEWGSFFGDEYLKVIEKVTAPYMKEFGYD